MERTVLLLVDLQRALIEEHPDHEQQLLERAQRLLKEARTSGIEAVFVRHDGSARGTLIPGSAGWELHPAVSPLPGERIFDKRFCSAFRGTGLRDYLRDRGISRIVLIGMQTEYCIDATCKVAFEYGFDVVIPRGCSSTFDTPRFSGAELCEFYENRVWNNCFARVVPAGEAFAAASEG